MATGSPCVSVTKDLGNYVLSGTLHVTLSPEVLGGSGGGGGGVRWLMLSTGSRAGDGKGAADCRQHLEGAAD